jgi:hypothetical protein
MPEEIMSSLRAQGHGSAMTKSASTLSRHIAHILAVWCVQRQRVLSVPVIRAISLKQVSEYPVPHHADCATIVSTWTVVGAWLLIGVALLIPMIVLLHERRDDD